MTSGFFTSEGEPAANLRVRGPRGAQAVEGVIDTGFDGDLTLPPDLITQLDLPEFVEEDFVLGDGKVHAVQLYAATVAFAGRTRRVLVGSAPMAPLLGTGLLQGLSLRIDFWDGGRVEIRERGPQAGP